jgi:hypothetical protein
MKCFARHVGVYNIDTVKRVQEYSVESTCPWYGQMGVSFHLDPGFFSSPPRPDRFRVPTNPHIK